MKVAKQLLNQGSVAERLGISPRTLEAWRVQGRGPRYCKLGGLVRYKESDIDDYIEEAVRTSTSELPTKGKRT